jgi:hypothetical protein
MFRASVAWKWNQYIRVPTVIASRIKAAKRFSNQARSKPRKAVRNGKNMYMGRFYPRQYVD